MHTTDQETNLALTASETNDRIDALNERAWRLRLSDAQQAMALAEEARLQCVQRSDAPYSYGLAQALLTQSRCDIQFSNLDDALRKAREAMRIFQELENATGEARSLNIIGITYKIRGDYHRALESLYQSLALMEAGGNREGQADALNNIGNVYSHLDNNSSALEYQYKSLALMQNSGNRIGEANVLNNIGGLYEKLNNQTIALEYYSKSLGLQEEMGNRFSEAVSLSNIGRIYMHLEEYPNALEHLNKSLAISNERGYREKEAGALANIGIVYAKSGEHHKAVEYYNKSYEIAQHIGSKEIQAEQLHALGDVSVQMRNIGKAIDYLRRALDLAQELQANKILINIHKSLANAYQLSDDSAKALEYFKLYHRVKEEIFNQETDRRLKNQHVLHELEQAKKEAEIYRLRSEQLQLAQTAAELEALHAKMNPHFIFNALNSIRHLVLVGEKEWASDYIEKFAKLMRMVLDNSKHASIPLAEAQESLELYLALEKLRYEDQLNYTIRIGDGIDAEEQGIPPMLVQPFVENAILHGLRAKPGGGDVAITFNERADALVCIVEDNGIGINKSRQNKSLHTTAHESFAMDGTQRRLQLLNSRSNNDISIRIIDVSEEDPEKTGTRIELYIPKDISIGKAHAKN